eukprot:6187507-Pleurochrysis_carterae.AAC.3
MSQQTPTLHASRGCTQRYAGSQRMTGSRRKKSNRQYPGGDRRACARHVALTVNAPATGALTEPVVPCSHSHECAPINCIHMLINSIHMPINCIHMPCNCIHIPVHANACICARA